MKKIYSLLASLVLLTTACKKNMDKSTLQVPSGIDGFTTSSNNIVFSSDNDSAVVTTFKWSAVNYTVSTPVTYSLLIDQVSDTTGSAAWGNAIKTTIAVDSLQKSWLGQDLNKLLNQLGLPDGQASTVVVRLQANVNQTTGSASTVPTLYTDLALTVTPYYVMHTYPQLYAAGDWQGWTPVNSPGLILASPAKNSTYAGFINFPNADNNFKLCTTTSWNDPAYGWGSSATTISASGGNLYFAGPGYCYVVADTAAHTISYTTTLWVMAGTFNSWSTTATPLTFDASTNTWTATGVALSAGDSFKFVGTSDWSYCIGDDGNGNTVEGSGSLSNFTVAKAGTYTVTLDLSHGAGNYSYSIK